jgi:hypothetical protein
LPFSAAAERPLIEDLAFSRRQDAGGDARQSRLAAAGFADEAEHLALADAEIDAVDRLQRRGRCMPADRGQDALGHIGLAAEIFADAAQLEQGLAHAAT